MPPSTVGFAVVYRWRLRDGMEDRFQRGWEAITERLLAERGALGSRLHRAGDGTWLAYAQWPSRQAWERSREQGTADPGAAALMAESVLESFPPILLDPVRDHLVR